MTNALTPAQLATWWQIADVVLPEWRGMPSASGADPRGKWLDKALAARPDLVGTLAAFLDEATGRPPEQAITTLAREDLATFADLLLVTQSSYYMNPKIRKRIGYPGQVARPIYPDEAEVYLEGDLLEPVTARGAVYRTVE